MMKLSTMKRIVDTLNKEWRSPVAEKIMQNWDHDKDSVFYFRSSANFVFRFTNNGKIFFLRFNSLAERTLKDIECEIETIVFLNQNNSDVVKPVLSKNNRYIEQVKNGNDTYIAVVFEGFDGKMYEVQDLDEEQFFLWGKSLGKLHKTMEKIPENIKANRKSWKDHLLFVTEFIPGTETRALKELAWLKEWIETVNAKEGIIHYDFELDNLHWYENKIKIFDLDDSAVYWYGADIAFALRDLFEEGVDTNTPQFRKFMDGYTSEFETDKNLFVNMPKFLRFHNLNSFVRILRSLDYKVDDETPEWLVVLNNKLVGIVNNYRNSFVS